MLQTAIIGNLGADAEVKEVNGKKFVSFNVAHTERWKTEDEVTHEKTLWVSCALNGDGGNILPYLKKGTMIYAIGRTSTRVYSSEKERGFVAGINLSVQHIELVGGKSDDVPSRLYRQDGSQVEVGKFFWTQEVNVYGTIIFDRSGCSYIVDSQGWITRCTPEIAPSADSQQSESAAQSDAPFEGETTQEEQKLQQKVSTRGKKK